MPTPSESKHEQVFLEAAARFAQISHIASPSKFHDTVDEVLDVDEFDVENLTEAPSSVSVIYQLLAGEVTTELRTTGGTQNNCEMWLLISKRIKDAGFLASKIRQRKPPSRRTYQSRLVMDLRTKLDDWRGDKTGSPGAVAGSGAYAFGSLLDLIEIKDEDRQFRVSEQVEWVQVGVRLVGSYTLTKGQS